MIEISTAVSIPMAELRFESTTSGGPGGQHANRSQTRVTLLFDLAASAALDERQKRRIRSRLATRIDREGRLRVRCGRHRSQAANREETIRRFTTLVREALRPRRRRVATGVPQAQRRKRLEAKRRRGEAKRLRRRPPEGE